MSTQPQLSPLEQLEQSATQQQSAPASSSGLSPLEQLEQSSDTQSASTVTPAQQAYRKATAAGPFTPPGAAEKAMGEAIGDNKAQAIQALKSTGQAALATGAGVVGASVAPEILPAAERVLQMSENALEHLGENY